MYASVMMRFHLKKKCVMKSVATGTVLNLSLGSTRLARHNIICEHITTKLASTGTGTSHNISRNSQGSKPRDHRLPLRTCINIYVTIEIIHDYIGKKEKSESTDSMNKDLLSFRNKPKS
jgi:hypothetical protein